MHDDGDLCDLSCELALNVLQPSVLLLQVAPASSAGELVSERLSCVDGAGAPLDVVEQELASRGRGHVLTVGPGSAHISYAATVRPAPPPGGGPAAGFDEEAIVGLRPSRYCPSDSFAGFAALTVPDLPSPPDTARAGASWIFENFVLGNTGGRHTDSAVDSLLAGAGVCRDFSHVLIALCRARGVPARFVSVYAPGLSPMDFHAVVEARTEHGWEVLDATRQAPRSTLVRIATGRDAADAAFLTTLEGRADLTFVSVLATTRSELPADDHVGPVRLA